MNWLSIDSARQRGATMLEVLVSILVFSFGMLGMLGLIVSSLKITSTSNFRSIAAEQLAAISDALNANPAIIADYLNAATSSPAQPTCFTTGCTTTQLAQTDYKLWQDRVSTLLPGGGATLCRDSSPADGAPGNWACSGTGRLVVKICWDESRVATAAGWSAPCLIGQP